MTTPAALTMFEGKQVRTEIAGDGSVLFCAKDVSDILGYENSREAIGDHCLESGVAKITIRSGGQRRSMTFLSEGNVFRLVAKSHMPNAKAFESWIFDTLVPTVLKTGTYTAASAPKSPARIGMSEKTRSILDIARILPRIFPGVRRDILASQTLKLIMEDTGIDTEAFRLALPVSKEEEIEKLNATHVGELCGLSARDVNKRLVGLGFQKSVERGGYEVVGDGLKHGSMFPFDRNGHTGFQPLWKSSVADVLLGVAPAVVKPPMFSVQEVPKRRPPSPAPSPQWAVVTELAKKTGQHKVHLWKVWLGDRESPVALHKINAAMRAAGLPERQA